MTRAGAAIGTAGYMPPEQALGMKEQVDYRADIYAVGATLYPALSGQRLHHGGSEQESYVLAATQPAPSVARVAPHLALEVVTIVDKALQWDRRNRYQTAEQMREAIEGLVSQATPAPSREPPLEERFAFELAQDGPTGPAPAVGQPEPGQAPLAHDEQAATTVADDGLDVELGQETGLELDMSFELDMDGDRDPPVPPAATPAVPPIATPAVAPQVAGPKVKRAAVRGDVPLAPSHPLAPLFTSVDRLLRTARQYGPAHPETQNRLTPVVEAMTQALRSSPRGVGWTVLPYCFTQDDETLWEPSPLGDLVPYTLSVAGLREVHVTEGVTEDELRELFGAMMIDATVDPAEIATALWEAPFLHVRCRLEEELGGEDAESLEEFFAETAEIEQQLREHLSAVQKLALAMKREDVMEAAAIASMTEAAETTAATLQIGDAARQALTAALAMDGEQMRVRHHDLLLYGFMDAASRQDVSTLTGATEAYANRLVRLGRTDELFATHRALMDRLGRQGGASTSGLTAERVTGALFPAEVLVHVARRASGWAELLDEQQSAKALSGFRLIAETMGPAGLPLLLWLADKLREGPVFEQILDYLARVAEGNEPSILSALEAMDPLTTQQILACLLESSGGKIRSMLQPLPASANTALRCEAIAQLAESKAALTDELMKLFQSADQSVRWAALDTFVRHRVVSAGPALVRLVEAEPFRQRPLDDQRKVLEALHALHPPRTEAMLSSLVGTHGLVANDALEQTRMLAARLLSEWAETDGAVTALRSATRRRPWNSVELRKVAEHAAGAIEMRVQGGLSSPQGAGA